MKKKIFIITILVMGLFAVQGYAQRENGRNQSHRVERSSNRSMSSVHSLRSSPSRNFSANQNSRSYRHSDVGDRGVRHYAPGRPNVDRNRPGALRYQRPPSGYHHRHMPPPPSHSWRPIFHHHHGFRHYHHHCYFNDWYWYRWGGYYNRFICHAQALSKLCLGHFFFPSHPCNKFPCLLLIHKVHLLDQHSIKLSETLPHKRRIQKGTGFFQSGTWYF